MRRKREIQKIITSCAPMGSRSEEIVTDPFGSYTGVPDDRSETPVQDADDL